MILSLNVVRTAPGPRPVPRRRRVVVLGATEAGVSAAFHLGAMASLVEQRDFSSEERLALYEVTAGNPQRVVERWDPPTLESMPTPAQSAARWNDVWRQVVSLMCGEVCLGSVVTAVDSAERRIEFATGDSIVYDKLVCTLRLTTLQRLLVDEQPQCVRGPEWWRCWLAGRDIELLDTATQVACGDVDGEAAGKRIAASLTRAMRDKYSRNPLIQRHEALFTPRLVGNPPAAS